MLPVWQQAYWTLAGAGAAIFTLGFFLLPETYYDREIALQKYSVQAIVGGKVDGQEIEVSELAEPIPARIPYLQQIKPWSPMNPKATFWLSLVRQFTFLGFPAVLWAIMFYGLAIGIGGLCIAFSFPTTILGPPYNWSVQASGTIAISTFIAVLISIPIGPLSDRWYY
jgi:hypothetical protein